jgi:16S rRNA (cytosine967-C5)-methyltransferase
MIAPARVAAYEVLRAVNAGRADLPNALARARAGLADERDRALAGEIAAGTLRWQAAFDHVVDQFAKRPAAKLDPEVLDILRLTMFQLLHLDRVPASAAVNDAVNLTRRAGKKSAAPLVNAVLRRVIRDRGKLPLPPRPPESPEIPEKGGCLLSPKEAAPFGDARDAISYLSVTLSHPKWLVARWLERYGFEATEAWARFDNGPAALTLRANTLKVARDELVGQLAEHGVETVATRFAPDGLVVQAGNPLLAPLASEGLFVVQDEASQLITVFAAPEPGEQVLDVCASPGGKTTAMAAMMGDRGRIVACDVRPRRLELLRRGVASSGASCVRIVQADASRTLPFSRAFDLVLLDAPCSGLGTLRRDPDIRWRRVAAELPGLADAQLAMLMHAAALVRPSGRLVYSTCSSEPEENEQVVARFLEARPSFTAAQPTALPQGMGRFLTRDGYLRTLPFRHGLEAFFAAMLVKTKDLR